MLFARVCVVAWCGGARLVGSWVCVPPELVVRRRDDGQMVAHRQRAPHRSTFLTYFRKSESGPLAADLPC
jgi:hypothetical protein